MKNLKILFTALLLLCCVGMAKAHDFVAGGIYYNISSSTNKTVGVTYGGDYSSDYDNEYTGSVVIPESVTYNGKTYSVTSIGYSAFYGCTGLTSIEIPNSVRSIGSYAFIGCTGLTAVHISDLAAWCGINFTNAYDNPLYYAKNLYLNGEKLTELVIPDGFVEIKDYTFYNCNNLTSVVIPNSVTSIGDRAFYYCSGLTSVVIGNSVTSIGGGAFYGCTGLTSFEVESGNSVYDSRDNCNAIIETATNTLIAGCQNTTIPNSVTSFGDGAFYECTGLTSVTIPNSVTSIGDSVFVNCVGLTSIEIPNSVTSIENKAFYGCTGLTSITIPNSVTSIGWGTFDNCSGLEKVCINDLEAWCGIDFGRADANPLCYAGNLYLNGELVTDLTIPSSVTSIGDYAFIDCTGLTNITIPSSVTSIGYAAFYGCSGLTSITIPNSVTSIGDYAFNGCSGLTSITIPNSITSIGNYAFENCTGLKTVINFSNLTFSTGSSSNGYVAYYADKVYNAPNGSIEGDFIFCKPNDVNTLVGYLGNATELTLPADYKGENYTIGADAFKGNATITSVVIPNRVTSIGDYTFYCCTGLTSIEIPNSVTSIGNSAFNGCTGLTSVEIPNSVTSIEYAAFNGCSNLETIYISSAIESIGNEAFAGCDNIKEIKVGGKKPIWGNSSIFTHIAYDNAILYVPLGSKAYYEKREPWNLFFYIVEMDFTGIDEVYDEVKGESGKVKAIYDLTGRKLKGENGKLKGIYIIDGKKVLVK